MNKSLGDFLKVNIPLLIQFNKGVAPEKLAEKIYQLIDIWEELNNEKLQS